MLGWGRGTRRDMESWKGWRRRKLPYHVVFFCAGACLGFCFGVLGAGRSRQLPAYRDQHIAEEPSSSLRATVHCPPCRCVAASAEEKPLQNGSPAAHMDKGRKGQSVAAGTARDGGGRDGSAGAPSNVLSPADLKKAANIEAIATMSGPDVFRTFYDFMPPALKPQMADTALVIATRGSGLRLPSKHQPGDPIHVDQLSTCKELDTVVLSRDRCYVALGTQLQYASQHIQRYESKQVDASWSQWSMVPRITKEGSTPPISYNRAKHERFLKDLFVNLESLEKDAMEMLKQTADAENRVMIMALNQGDTDMLINFLCSARKAGVPVNNLLIFGGDEAVADVARSLGLHAFSHPAFGQLPKAHAKHYGDAPFLEMMWLKIVSVWVAVRLGFDVLFQDADLVWFKDPWPVFSDAKVDGYFSDDGSRSERFSPLYANSGFYFLRSNARTIHFMQTMLFSWDMVVQYASHQTIFIMVLQEHISRNALNIRVLSEEEFVGGKMYHHRKDLMKRISDGTYVPYTFHMCWTQTKADKLAAIKDARLWYLHDDCSAFDSIYSLQQTGALTYDRCCVVGARADVVQTTSSA